MAPERASLKRKRSRPSEWWAANPSTPQQIDSDPKDLSKIVKANRPERATPKDPKLHEISKHKDADVITNALAKPRRKQRPSQSEDEPPTTTSSPKLSDPEAASVLKESSISKLELQGDIDQTGLKKRRRPAASASQRGRKTSKDVVPRKGNRPLRESKNHAEAPIRTNIPTEEKSKKRGGPKLVATPNPGEEELPGEISLKNLRVQEHRRDIGLGSDKTQENRGRRRTKQADVVIAEQEVLAISIASDVEPVSRKRKHLADREESERRRKGTRELNAESNVKATTRSTKTRRAHSSQDLPIIEVEAASSRLTKSRSVVKKISKVVPTRREPKDVDSSSLTTKSQSKEIAGTAQNSNDKSIGSARHRRVSKPIQAEEPDPSPPDAELPYQHLVEMTRKVSRQIIEAKWGPLPSSCVDLISQILDDTQRPVVARLNDERKRNQASTALQMVSRRLVGKISRGLPFPPGTRPHQVDDFDFETILDHNRSIEAQLTPILHANELLEMELNKELGWLESERRKLAELETNARTETVLRNEAARKEHQVLQLQEPLSDLEGVKEDIGLDRGSYEESQLLQVAVSNDEDVSLLIKDIEGHVESIQGNIKAVDGITATMAKTRAVVQSTLYDHLDSGQYEEVVLGMD